MTTTDTITAEPLRFSDEDLAERVAELERRFNEVVDLLARTVVRLTQPDSET
jgi:hypothetical protein